LWKGDEKRPHGYTKRVEVTKEVLLPFELERRAMKKF
jgi:hypothetical protein